MFEVTAACHIDYDSVTGTYGALHMDQPHVFRAVARNFQNEVKFPKWVDVKLSNAADGTVNAHIAVHFATGKGNSKNETGAKRVLKFIKLVGAVSYKADAYKNSYPSIYDVLEAMEKVAA